MTVTRTKTKVDLIKIGLPIRIGIGLLLRKKGSDRLLERIPRLKKQPRRSLPALATIAVIGTEIENGKVRVEERVEAEDLVHLHAVIEGQDLESKVEKTIIKVIKRPLVGVESIKTKL